MPPAIALSVTVVFSSGLLLYLSRRRTFGAALWLPVTWIFFIASKFPSQWLQDLGLWNAGGVSMEEGSPLDAAFFLSLILLGIAVLVRRRVDLSELLRSNLWMTAFLLYCLVAILWSEFPIVALKRWIKVLGHPVMALVILTNPNPLGAVRSVLQRAAILTLPWSILFIKYYPELGRSFDAWTGAAVNSGIHHNKNELGYTCMVLGIFFIWNMLAARRLVDERARRSEMLLSGLWLSMIWWLLTIAGSATSLMCTVLGGTAAAAIGSRVVSKRFIGVQLTVVLVLLVAADMTFGIYSHAIEMLGRNPTLTDRTKLWADLLAFDTNPLVGAGFESFWLGSRRELLWEKWLWKPNQAHNGYIETYINLGWLGVALLSGVIFSTFRKGRAALLRDVDEGRLRLGFLFAILVYNYTEATFKGVHLVWTMFYLIALDYRPLLTSAKVQGHPSSQPPPRVVPPQPRYRRSPMGTPSSRALDRRRA